MTPGSEVREAARFLDILKSIERTQLDTFLVLRTVTNLRPSILRTGALVLDTSRTPRDYRL